VGATHGNEERKATASTPFTPARLRVNTPQQSSDTSSSSLLLIMASDSCGKRCHQRVSVFQEDAFRGISCEKLLQLQQHPKTPMSQHEAHRCHRSHLRDGICLASIRRRRWINLGRPRPLRHQQRSRPCSQTNHRGTQLLSHNVHEDLPRCVPRPIHGRGSLS